MRLKSLAGIVGLAAAYVLAAQIGFLATPDHHAVSTAWPPAGVALAALVLFGRSLWPGVALGAVIANLTADLGILVAVLIAAGNTLEAVAGWWVLQRFQFRPAMDRVRDVFALSGVAVVTTMVSATIGVLALRLHGTVIPEGAGMLWLEWWTGDALGILVVAPLLLTWGSAPMVGAVALIEPTLLVIALAALTVFVVGRALPFVYPVFPAAGLAAYRLGSRGAAAANITVAAVGLFFTIRGAGAFIDAGDHLVESLFLFQAFVGLLAVTTLGGAAILAERRHAEADVRETQAHLAEAQQMAHLGSWQWHVDSNRVEWSDELYRIYGLDPATSPATIQGYLDLVHPEDRERVETSIRGALRERTTFRLDERIIRPDGTVRVLETRGKVLLPDGRRSLVMTGVCQDVTDSRYAQLLLEASEAKFAAMFSASPVAICVIALDKTELIDANARFYEMLGNVPKGSVIGVSPRELGMWTEPGEMRDLVARLRKTRSVREIPVRFLTRDGLERRALAALELMEINGRECAVTLFWRP